MAKKTGRSKGSEAAVVPETNAAWSPGGKAQQREGETPERASSKRTAKGARKTRSASQSGEPRAAESSRPGQAHGQEDRAEKPRRAKTTRPDDAEIPNESGACEAVRATAPEGGTGRRERSSIRRPKPAGS